MPHYTVKKIHLTVRILTRTFIPAPLVEWALCALIPLVSVSPPSWATSGQTCDCLAARCLWTEDLRSLHKLVQSRGSCCQTSPPPRVDPSLDPEVVVGKLQRQEDSISAADASRSTKTLSFANPDPLSHDTHCTAQMTCEVVQYGLPTWRLQLRGFKQLEKGVGPTAAFAIEMFGVLPRNMASGLCSVRVISPEPA